MSLFGTKTMTGMPQFIDPHPGTWAGGPQCIFVCVRQAEVLSANNCGNEKRGA